MTTKNEAGGYLKDLKEVDESLDALDTLYEKEKERFTLSKARMRAVLSGQEPDMIPVYFSAHVDTLTPFVPVGDFMDDPGIMIRTILQSMLVGFTELQQDYSFDGRVSVVPYLGNHLETSMIGCKIVFHETDVPSLSHDEDVLVIKDKADIDIWEFPDPSEHVGLAPRYLEYYESFKQALGSRANVGTGLNGSHHHPFDLACHVYGVDRFYLLLYEDPARAHKLLEKLTEWTIKFKKFVIDFNDLDHTSKITLSENYSAYISPEMYREFTIPYTRRIFDEFPEHPKYMGIDGPFTPTLPDLAKHLPDMTILGVAQETDIGVVREALGDKVIFRGNINPVKTLLNGSRDEIIEAVKSMIRKATRDYRCSSFYVATDDAVAPYTPIENLKTAIAAAREYGRLDRKS